MRTVLYGSLVVITVGVVLAFLGFDAVGVAVLLSGTAVFAVAIGLMWLSMSKGARQRREDKP